MDGVVGPSSPLSYSDLFNSGNLKVNFNDYGSDAFLAGKVTFAGLTPTVGGLYQINVQVPSGLTAGDNVYVEIVTDAADINEIQIPYGAGAVTPNVVAKAARREAAKVGARARDAREDETRGARGETTPAVAVSTNR